MALKAEGRTSREIAVQLGLSIKTIRQYARDPTGELMARRRAEYNAKHQGICEVCGAVTRGRTLTNRCVRHPKPHPVWTEERIIEAIQRWAFTFGEPPTSTDWNTHHCYQVNDPGRAARFKRLHNAGLIPSFSVVYNRFGSWGAAMKAAGFPALPPHGGSDEAKRHREEARARRANRPGIVLHTAQR